ncbi:hypothetical protein H310_04766 [Aphanomyces invadans]|uniref:Uncharacterized protein n=1 Tax=Aphanomyces invadans TaxID=157072 RepID=A0A024UF60_9STRA|nr:hypothetical protein H310_04766 [Aphanomyces invadans]ETW04512.1 hypothetical protein H310_04766 [Aphanomyces invadans]|eukprot:XP_008867468.1 hypothetical protein H310_04766 [Aphanomyces invadans]
MDVWDSVARNLATMGEFDRPQFDGKKAQARFLILLRDHRESNNASQRASGAAENVTEKIILLHDICNQVGEAKREENNCLTQEYEEASKVEENGAFVREEAMKSQRKRMMKDEDDSGGGYGGKMLKQRCLEIGKLIFEK